MVFKNIKAKASENELLELLIEIDHLTGFKDREKLAFLSKSSIYLDFINIITGCDKIQITDYLTELSNSEYFFSELEKKLKIIENIDHTGDLRFHSVTLYLLVRILKPKFLIETGVAYGKSTTYILEAINKNNCGELVSIDLPNKKGVRLKDGAYTSAEEYGIGWLVPERLKKNWSLIIGNSISKLNEIEKIYEVDFFFHDSLHTYDHLKSELSIVSGSIFKNKGTIIVDDIDLEIGNYFDKFLEERNQVAYSLKNLAILNIK